MLKVEDPSHPDDARSMGPHFQGDQSLYFVALNSGKRSIGVKLASDEGRAVVEDLVRGADVVIDNYRPGVLAKFGLGHDALHAVNPAIVTCSLTGYGETGPDAQRAGYDYTIQALAGVMSLAGEPEGPPTKAGISYVDHSGGISAALGSVRRARGTVAYRDRHARRRQPLRRADLDAHLPRLVAAQPRRCLRAHRELCAPVAGAGAELPHRRRPSRAVRRERRHVATVRRRGGGSGVGVRSLRHTRGTARTPRGGDRGRPARAPHRTESRVGGAPRRGRRRVRHRQRRRRRARGAADPRPRARGAERTPCVRPLRARSRTVADPGHRHTPSRAAPRRAHRPTYWKASATRRTGSARCATPASSPETAGTTRGAN